MTFGYVHVLAQIVSVFQTKRVPLIYPQNRFFLITGTFKRVPLFSENPQIEAPLELPPNLKNPAGSPPKHDPRDLVKPSRELSLGYLSGKLESSIDVLEEPPRWPPPPPLSLTEAPQSQAPSPTHPKLSQTRSPKPQALNPAR